MRFAHRIRSAVDRELAAAALSENPAAAFRHLERAHVLGQASTRQHLRAHWAMLRWGWRQRDWREVRGQLLRLVGAATKTFVGLVPTGNTGGSNVSPFRLMPVPSDLQAEIDRARRS